MLRLPLLTSIFFVASLCWLTKGNQLPATEITEEDKAVLNKTIAKYGPFKDFRAQDLPGPEFEVDENITLHDNVFSGNINFKYILRIRTISNIFSYNSRYEIGEIINIDNVQKIHKFKGQFGEHFMRESGGFYIRSIGYIIDENGYQEFLIDLSIVTEGSGYETELAKDAVAPMVPHEAGISSTVLITLNGGNMLG